MEQTGLDFNRGVAVFWSLAATVTGTIESDDSMTRRQRCKDRQPILRRSGVAVNQHDRAANALGDVVQSRPIYRCEF